VEMASGVGIALGACPEKAESNHRLPATAGRQRQILLQQLSWTRKRRRGGWLASSPQGLPQPGSWRADYSCSARLMPLKAEAIWPGLPARPTA
jgi:hypothetical protein